MAPEQAAGDPRSTTAPTSTRSAAWRYELLTGQPPFHGRQVHQIIAAQIAESPPPVATLRDGLPPGLASLVDRCLEKAVDHRPQSAAELLAGLDALATPSASPKAPSVTPPRRGFVIAAAAAGAVAILAMVFYGAAMRRAAGSAPADGSLAVIPFVNIGGDSAQDYLADGVSDELATAIGKLGGVRMTARSAAYRYRGHRDLDVRQTGKSLQARFLIQGSIQRAGDALRISAQLNDATTGDELWSDTYQRKSGDVFRTQDEITSAIALALAPHLPALGGSKRPARAHDGRTADAGAYDLFLHAEFLMRRRQVDAAIDAYKQAIARDSTLARAYAGLSHALELTPYYNATPPDSVRGAAIAAASRALALDSGLARAHMALGLAYMHAWQWRDARAAYERAIAADQNDLETRLQYGRFLYFTGDDGGALTQWRRAQTIDPFYAVTAAWIALLMRDQGNSAEALAQIRRALDYDSTAGVVRGLASQVLMRVGDPAEARAIARRLPVGPPWDGERAYTLGKLGDTADARAVVRSLEALPETKGFKYNALAMAYVGLGDTARALTALEHADAAHEAWPLFHRLSDALWTPLRQSARWAAVARRVGLDTMPHVLP